MAKSKLEKGIKEVKKDINEFVDDAKDSTNKAAKYVKNKTK